MSASSESHHLVAEADTRLLSFRDRYPRNGVVLTALLEHAPNADVRKRLAREIVSSRDWELNRLASGFNNFLLEPMELGSLQTSEHSAFDQLELGLELEALKRDEFTCAITGRYDHGAAHANGLLHPKNLAAECCARAWRILPYPCQGVHIDDFLAYLSFYGDMTSEEVNEDALRSFQNVMTLGSDLEEYFRDTNMWLDPVPGTQGMYIFCKTDIELPGPEDGAIVCLKASEQGTGPNPKFIALHAACSKVIEVIYDFEDQEDVIDVPRVIARVPVPRL